MRKYQWRDGARDLGIMATLAFSFALCSDSASAQSGEHRWGGIVFDAFAYDTGSGVKAWSVEDGGRIRFRDPTLGTWSFQTVPDVVRDTLHRVTFLTSGAEAGLRGWAVGQDGRVLRTSNGGASGPNGWATVGPQILVNGNPEELYDVSFINATDGWLVGKHSFWFTNDGGLNWSSVTVYDPRTQQFLDLTEEELQLYGLDVVQRTGGSLVGLAVLEPGIVLRGDSSVIPPLSKWDVVFDIRDLCNGMNPTQCRNATGLDLKGCECDVCPDTASTLAFEPWDVEISRNEDPQQKLALFTGGIIFQCGLVFRSTDDGLTWTKEWHECQCLGLGCKNCTNDPLYNDDPTQPDLNRHQHFKTLYGLGILDGSNAAFAGGYNGQFVVRNPQTHVWEDRSIFSPAVPTTTNCVKYPMSGTEALMGPGGSNLVIVTGMGGHIVETNDLGSNYDLSKAVGEPHRTKCVYFMNLLEGWQGGQFFRIGRSPATQGVTWVEQDPPPSPQHDENIRAVAFEPLGLKGVAVGDWYTDPQTDTPRPKIRYTDNGGTTAWREDVSNGVLPSYLENNLLEVTWVSGDVFWAAGTGGLILSSSDAGQTWRPSLPSIANFNQFTIEGLTFLDVSNGIFVGFWPNGTGSAYHYKAGQPPSWTAISLPTGLTITGLYDVDWNSSDAAVWAVGEKSGSTTREGIVLRSQWNGLSFDPFVEKNAGGFPLCNVGDDVEESPVLTEVEVDTGSGDVWVGGMCGRVWLATLASGFNSWTLVKSQTSAHVTDMSFVTGSQAYVNGYRSGPLQQCIVRVHKN